MVQIDMRVISISPSKLLLANNISFLRSQRAVNVMILRSAKIFFH